jgi:hypothetical protein
MISLPDAVPYTAFGGEIAIIANRWLPTGSSFVDLPLPYT